MEAEPTDGKGFRRLMSVRGQADCKKKKKIYEVIIRLMRVDTELYRIIVSIW